MSFIVPGDLVTVKAGHYSLWNSDSESPESLFELSKRDSMFVVSVGDAFACCIVKDVIGFVNVNVLRLLDSCPNNV